MGPARRAAILEALKAGNVIQRVLSMGDVRDRLKGIPRLRQAEVNELCEVGLLRHETREEWKARTESRIVSGNYGALVPTDALRARWAKENS